MGMLLPLIGSRYIMFTRFLWPSPKTCRHTCSTHDALAIVYCMSLMSDGYCGPPSMFKSRHIYASNANDGYRWETATGGLCVILWWRCIGLTSVRAGPTEQIRIQIQILRSSSFREIKFNIPILQFCTIFVLLCLIVQWDDFDVVATEETKKGKKNKSDNVDVISVCKIRQKKLKKKPQKSNFVKASTNAFGNNLCSSVWE